MSVPILIGAFLSMIRDATRGPAVASVLGTASGRDRFTLNVQYSSRGRKIPGLPNNGTNEMIRGCEIRSISGQRPPPRSLHDDPVERRLVVHGL